MLAYRLRRWPNIKITLNQRIVFNFGRVTSNSSDFQVSSFCGIICHLNSHCLFCWGFINLYTLFTEKFSDNCRLKPVASSKVAYFYNVLVNNFFYLTKEVVYNLLNPCPAEPGYIRLQESFNPNEMPLKLIKYSVVDAQLMKYFNLGDVYFS